MPTPTAVTQAVVNRMSTVRRSGKAIVDDLQATGRVLADFLHRTYSVKRARIVLAVALNFCLLYAIGLGTIDAAVRLRNCDGALASRIRALSLTLNIHSFTSGRAGTFRSKHMHDKGHIFPAGRLIKTGSASVGFRNSPAPTVS